MQLSSIALAVTALLGPSRGPSLDLSFLSPDTFDSRITFTAGSAATYTDRTGVLRTAGLNMLLWSEDFTNGAWSTFSMTRTANVDLAPDGTQTADLLSFSGSGAGTWQPASPDTATPITISCWVKRAGSTNQSFRLFVRNSLRSPDLVATDSWQRFSYTASTTGTGTNAGITQDSLNSASSILVWGAQLETGTTPTIYAKTTTAASRAPRIDHNPALPLGQNLLTFSEDFTNAAWPKDEVSVVPGAAISPNGTNTAQKLVESTANSLHWLRRSGATVGTQQVFSVYAKAAERSQIAIQLGGDAAYFDLANGTVLSGAGASIVPAGSGWYRCVLTATPTNLNTLIFTAVAGSVSYTGNGTSGVFIWGAQLEPGTTAGPYIPTETTFTGRASLGSYIDADGVLKYAGVNLLTHSAGGRRSANIGATNNGVTTSVVGTGTQDGVEYIDVRFAGTPTQAAMSADGLLFSGITNARIPATANTPYTLAWNAIILSGAPTVRPNLYLCAETAASAFLDLRATDWQAPATLTARRHSVTWTTPANTAQMRVALALGNLSVGIPIDVVVRFGAAQLETGTMATTYCPTRGSAQSLARVDYDPVTRVSRGLLIEPQRTNSLRWSNDLTNAVWILHGCTVQTEVGPTPSGLQSVNKIVETAETSQHQIYQGGTVAVSGQPYTISAYVKPSGRFGVLLATDAFGDFFIPDVRNNAASTPVGGGWYRVSCTRISAITGGTAAYFALLNGLGQKNYTGDGTSGIYICGAQLEAGSSATSYIPTTTAQVTRAADTTRSEATTTGYGPELVTNGNFTNGTTGWTQSGTTHTVVDGELELTATTQFGSSTQLVATVPGVTYRLRVFARLGTSTQAFVKLRDLSGSPQAAVANLTPFTSRHEVLFTATGTSTIVELQNLSAGLGTFYVQSVSVQEVRYAVNGLLIEEQRTNMIRNNTMVGAVAGTPGTLPTNWGLGGIIGGLSSQVVGTGTESGISYLDIRIFGTNSSGSNVFPGIFFDTTTAIAGTSGQVWAASVYLGLVSGTGIVFDVSVHELDSGGAFLRPTTIPGTAEVPTSGALRARRRSGQVTLGASTAFVRPLIAATVANGVSVDFTLRIGMPQMEQGAFATSVIPTTTAAATRSADTAVMTGTNFSSWYSQSAGTMFAEYSYSQPTKSNVAVPLGVNINGNNRFIADVGTSSPSGVRKSAVSLLDFKNPGGTAQAAAGNGSILGAGAFYTAIFDGTYPTQMFIGSQGSLNFMNGHIRTIRFYPRAFPATELQALTA